MEWKNAEQFAGENGGGRVYIKALQKPLKGQKTVNAGLVRTQLL